MINLLRKWIRWLTNSSPLACSEKNPKGRHLNTLRPPLVTVNSRGGMRANPAVLLRLPRARRILDQMANYARSKES